MTEAVPDPTQAPPEPALGRRTRVPRRVAAALLVFLAAALASRFVRLGERALHHDESIHAFMSYTLAKDGNWRYDPAYHGPFLYYANALVYKIAGASNTTARFLPAVFGLILLAFAWPLVRWLGKPAAAFYAVLLLLSPHIAYFSRFIREDLYSLVFTLATILAFQMYLETDRTRWLFASTVAFAFAGVTKENAYMTGVLFVAYGIWAFAVRAFTARGSGGAATAATETWGWIRRHFVLLVSAGIVFLFLWALMYTAFGRYPGDWLAIPKAVKYWMGQHAIARIAGPWWYYGPQLLMYETGILFLLPFAFRERPKDPFFHFLCFWAVSSVAIYSWAREKVPWLTVHPLLPLAILASIGAANLWRDRRQRLPQAALVVAGVLVAVNAYGLYLACFRYGAHDVEREPNHAEMLAYVQTSEDLVRALKVTERARERVPGSEAVITVTGEASWPLTWYLRETPTKWAGRLEEASTPIIVVDWDPDGAIEKQLRERYDARRVPIRAWWFPGVIPGSGPNAVRRPTLQDLIRLWLFHEIWSPIGSQDSTFLVRKDLAGSGVLAPLSIRIEDTSSRDYGQQPDTIAPVRAQGEAGTGPGNFGEPRGLASDPAGNLYVADTKNHRIQVFDAAGRPLRAFGSQGQGDGQLNEPCGVAVDPQSGDVWVADTWNARIAHFSADGRWKGALTDGEKPFFGPRAVAVSRGVVFVADTGNKRIVRFDAGGKKLGEWGGNGNGPGQFVEPVGLAADAIGNLYVCDTGNHRVQVFDPEGKFTRQFTVYGWKDFYTEPYLALGPSGSVFVTDAAASRVSLYDGQGQLRRTWKPADPFKGPTGIAVDSFGTLTVSDRGMNRLFSWSLSSVMK